MILALEVERTNGVGVGQPLDDLGSPVRRGIELELEVRIAVEPISDTVASRRVLEPRAHDEANRIILAVESLREGRPSLFQCEIERGALKRRLPVVSESRFVLFVVEVEIDIGYLFRELVEGVFARYRKFPRRIVKGVVGLIVVGDVLALPGFVVAMQRDDSRRASETT